MIRNVVMVKMREGYDREWLTGLFDRLQGLGCPGTLHYSVGMDLGMREGNWSFAVVAYFADDDAYRGYDLDEVHNELRAELAPHTDEIARVQFRL